MQTLTPDTDTMDATDTVDDALARFAQSALGGGLASEAAQLLAEAGRVRERPAEALGLLERARAIAPAHPAPLIALYRFHFYGHRLADARAVGEDALSIARSVLGADFGRVPPSRDAVRYDAAERFYLFTLKGLAYLHMRQGELASAQTLLAELRSLDPEDQVGGALLLHVLMRCEDDVDGDGAGVPRAYPARGWAVPL
ncbi:tetratricopeptide repeat protein [Paraburkholderia tropica]|uniref:hypothetical protein n=1 Tax=Paraburkholderia tropica TaxID=92647 RepID=UPI0021AAC1B3|nr:MULTISPECIES: hypothetical protein [Paraburkholderia]